MRDTLSPLPPLHVTALPTVSPASGPPTDFPALPPDTGAPPAWPGSVLAPGAVPIASFRLAPPAPIEQGPPGPTSVDLGAAPPRSAVLPAYPGQALALVGSLLRQTGPGRCYSDRRETRLADQSSAGGVRL